LLSQINPELCLYIPFPEAILTDFLNQVFQAWSDRIRSPILGSVVLAFIAINWKPLYYLFFAETSVLTRFAYFDMKTDLGTLFLGPLAIGLLVGPVTKLFRSFDLVFCHKGETSWHRNQPRNSAQRQCA